MTIITVVQKSGEAAIAADSLISMGDVKLEYANTGAQKIIALGDSYLAAAGHCVNNQILLSIYESEPHLFKLHSATAIFKTFTQLQKKLHSDYYATNPIDTDEEYKPLSVTPMIVNPTGIYEVCSSRGAIRYDKFWAQGSGWQFALGAMVEAYDESDGCYSADTIAHAGVQAACRFDKSCSLPSFTKTVKLKHKLVVESTETRDAN